MLTVRIQAIDGAGTFTLPDFQPCRLLIPCSGDFAPGRGGLRQLLGMPLLPCCRFHPAEVAMPHRSDFGTPFCLRPTEAGSALGSTPFEATFTFTVVTARQLVVSPRETLSIGFRILISLHPAIQTTGRLTFAPAGLPPAEHTSLNWTHFRTAGFPQYGWKVGFPSGTFLDRRQLKPAPGMRCPPSSLQSALRAPRGQRGYPALCRAADSIGTAMEGYYSSTPGVLARVRVIVSRSVITYATPSVPLVGTSRFHRKAAYTRCLRCAGAPRRPTSGSGLSLLIPS